jgi:hypothetical protein
VLAPGAEALAGPPRALFQCLGNQGVEARLGADVPAAVALGTHVQRALGRASTVQRDVRALRAGDGEAPDWDQVHAMHSTARDA